MNHNIAFVDDQNFILQSLKWIFESDPYQVLTFKSPIKALQELSLQETAVIAADLSMPEMDGVTFLKQVKERCPVVECFLMTGHSHCTDVEEIACSVIYKPWNVDSLKTEINEAVTRFEANMEAEIKHDNQSKADTVC